jgi:hypothetical protein
VAAGTRVGIRSGNAIERYESSQRSRTINDTSAIASRERTSCAVLIRPVGAEQGPAVRDELRQLHPVQRIIIKVTRDRAFASEPRLRKQRCCPQGHSALFARVVVTAAAISGPTPAPPQGLNGANTLLDCPHDDLTAPAAALRPPAAGSRPQHGDLTIATDLGVPRSTARGWCPNRAEGRGNHGRDERALELQRVWSSEDA